MKKRSIVVIGSANMDLVCRTARRPAPGETVLGRDFVSVPGGKGANQAVAAARLGGTVHLIGRVGDDPFGSDLLDGLRRNGVDTEHVRRTADTSSGVAMIVVDDAGENSILVTPGANGHLSPADIDAAEPIIAGAACVMMQLETPYETIAHAIDVCRHLGIFTILDPAPAPALMPEWLYHVDVLTPNQAEARMILGLNDAAAPDEQVARLLLDRGPACVVLKLGSKGAMILDTTGRSVIVSSFPVDVVDTTAAGDAFTAGLAVALSEEMELPAAVRFATAAGALACTALGAQLSLPTRAAVETLLAGRP